MGHLILVGGASGAGKSFLFDHIGLVDPAIRRLRKLTTRPPRPHESAELTACPDLILGLPEAEVKACTYHYEYAGHWYGIREADLDRIARGPFDGLLIVRTGVTTWRIKKDYPRSAALYLHGMLDAKSLREKMRQQGREDVDIEERMRRNQIDYRDFIHYILEYDYVLLNDYETEALLVQLRNVIADLRERGEHRRRA